MADLADQLGWCMTSKDHLENLSDAIAVSQSNLENVIFSLHQTSFSNFNNWLLPIKEQFDKGATETQQFIYDHHLAYIEEQVAVIIEVLEKTNHQQSANQ